MTKAKVQKKMLESLKLADPKADIFLAANVMDATLTYVALHHETPLMEFNSIVWASMNTIGIGPTLFVKVILGIAILWVIRKVRQERLLIPLAAFLAMVALANLMVLRSQGIDI